MYVMEKDGQHYVYVRDGKPYVSTLRIEGTSALTIYLPDGTLLTNATVSINGKLYATDGKGKVYVDGVKGKREVVNIAYGEGYKGSTDIVYGTDETINLIQLFLLTVAATGFTYSDKFTITTTIENESYVGSISMYLPSETSVNVAAKDTSGEGDYSYSTSVKVDSVNTGKMSHTFTMDADHDITFTDGTRTYIGGGN